MVKCIVSVVVTCVLLALPAGNTMANGLLGAYVGGAVGQAQVDTGAPYVGGFRENHSAFKVMAGLRPISMVGAEYSANMFGNRLCMKISLWKRAGFLTIM